MLVLALDTTSRAGSIALARGESMLATFSGDATVTHGERLPGDLLRVLEGQGFHVRDVDLFAVAAGPGSFTGLRIGIATLQGLAMANDKPLIGVSALDAINDAVLTLSPTPPDLSPDSDVCVFMDAQRGQVFCAVYRGDQIVEGPIVDTPVALLTTWQAAVRRPQMFAGDGALAYGDRIRAMLPDTRIIESLPPLAPSIARLGAARVREGTPSAPDAIRPIYLRKSDAEHARDRLAAR